MTSTAKQIWQRLEIASVILQDLCRQPLLDLGDALHESYRHIFSVGYDDVLLAQYLNTQFTVDSDKYIQQGQHTEFSGRVLQRCLALSPLDISAEKNWKILDLGSGAGNSIFPLRNLFPKSFIVASDLSPQMLLALKYALEKENQDSGNHCGSSISLLQLNAESLEFHDNSFHLIVGMALLHHLINPALAVRESARVLQPGGVAIFVEPFENGNYLLSLAYQMILRDRAAAKDVSPAALRFLQEKIQAVSARSGIDKTETFLHNQDDKWLFTRHLIEQEAYASGFSRCIFMPVAQQADALTRKTKALMRYQQLDITTLPDWAWAIIGGVELGMSPSLRQEMPLEAGIILCK